MSVIDISKPPEVILISSDETEEGSWSFGSETSNSNNLDYKPREWNRKRKLEKELEGGVVFNGMY